MRNPGGYLTINDPEKPLIEHDTFTCGHCNRITIVPHKANPEDIGGLCKVCMQLICPQCVNDGNCKPFEKRIEQYEKRQAFLRSIENA